MDIYLVWVSDWDTKYSNATPFLSEKAAIAEYKKEVASGKWDRVRIDIWSEKRGKKLVWSGALNVEED